MALKLARARNPVGRERRYATLPDARSFPDAIKRTAGTGEMLSQDMGIDLGGGDIIVTEQLLDRANIGAVTQQIRGKAVPKGMAGNALVSNPRFTHSSAEEFPYDTLVKMMSAKLACYGVCTGNRGRKDECPGAGPKSSRILSRQRYGHGAAESVGVIRFLHVRGDFDQPLQRNDKVLRQYDISGPSDPCRCAQ